jgi:hypothetical protein
MQFQAQAEDYLSDPESSRSYYKFLRFNLLHGLNARKMIKPDLPIGDEETPVENIALSLMVFGNPLKTSLDLDNPQLRETFMHLMVEDGMPRFNRDTGERVLQVHSQIYRSQGDYV